MGAGSVKVRDKTCRNSTTTIEIHINMPVTCPGGGDLERLIEKKGASA